MTSPWELFSNYSKNKKYTHNCIKGWKGLSDFLNQNLFPWAGGSRKQPLKYLKNKTLNGGPSLTGTIIWFSFFHILLIPYYCLIPPKNLEVFDFVLQNHFQLFSKILPIIITFPASAIKFKNCYFSFAVYHLKLLHCLISRFLSLTF